MLYKKSLILEDHNFQEKQKIVFEIRIFNLKNKVLSRDVTERD